MIWDIFHLQLPFAIPTSFRSSRSASVIVRLELLSSQIHQASSLALQMNQEHLPTTRIKPLSRDI